MSIFKASRVALLITLSFVAASGVALDLGHPWLGVAAVMSAAVVAAYVSLAPSP